MLFRSPDFVRRGIGSRILALCETAARAEGFKAVQLTATMAGLPLYRACGFKDVQAMEDRGVPLVLMHKSLI